MRRISQVKLFNALLPWPLAVALLSACALAQDAPESVGEKHRLSYGAEADFSSAYVWRGIVLDNRPVVQPSASVSLSGFTLTAWSNFPFRDAPETIRLRTTDLNLSYARTWKRLRIEPAIDSLLNRPFRGLRDRNSTEASLTLSYRACPIRIVTAHSFDVGAFRGAYFGRAGVGLEKGITNRTSLDASFNSGWASSKFNETYIGVDKPALNFIGIEGALTYYVKPHIYLQPHVEFNDVVDRRLRANLTWPTFVSFGLAIGVDF